MFELIALRTPYSEIVRIFGISRSTVNKYVSAYKSGLKDLTAFFEHQARMRGYNSYGDYRRSVLLANNTEKPPAVNQRYSLNIQYRFERKMFYIDDPNLKWNEPFYELKDMSEIKDIAF